MKKRIGGHKGRVLCFAFIIVIVMLTTGCVSYKSMYPTQGTEDASPAMEIETLYQPEAIETSQSPEPALLSTPTSLTPDTLQLSTQTSLPHATLYEEYRDGKTVLEDYTFNIQHPLLGDLKFIPLVDKSGGQHKIEFILTDEQQQIYIFPHAYMQWAHFTKLSEVEITDIDEDGLDDIVVIAYCIGGATGGEGAVTRSYVTIYFQREYGYAAFEKLDYELTYEAAVFTESKKTIDPATPFHYRDTTLEIVLDYIGKNIPYLEEYFSD